MKKEQTDRMRMNKTTENIALGGVIAALYVVGTFLSNLVGLSSGAVQLRVSEALCILPCFTSAAIPGLFIGCLLANLMTGALLPDVVFGSLATLLGAFGTRLLRKNRYLAVLPPIIANVVIVPQILVRFYKLEDGLLYLTATVGAGEVLSCGLLGILLYSLIDRTPALKTALERKSE